MANATKNHTVSACYLDQWTDADRCLAVARLRAGKIDRSTPQAVGWRKKFWGEDKAQRAEIEQLLCRLERDAAPIVQTLPDRWPIHQTREEWVVLLHFVAMHLIRTPFWRADLRKLQHNALAEELPVWHAALPAHAVDELIRHVSADRFHNSTMLGQIPKTASVLGSMHCSLLAFEAASLITGDHPAVAVPLLAPREVAEMRPLPTSGLLGTMEFRFPIDPHHALLFTWFDSPHPETTLHAGYDVACDLNRSIAGQALFEWYHHPETTPAFVCPPFLPGPCRPIGPAVLGGYDVDHARKSRRRRAADQIMRRLIEDGVTDRIETVTVQEERAA